MHLGSVGIAASASRSSHGSRTSGWLPWNEQLTGVTRLTDQYSHPLWSYVPPYLVRSFPLWTCAVCCKMFCHVSLLSLIFYYVINCCIVCNSWIPFVTYPPPPSDTAKLQQFSVTSAFCDLIISPSRFFFVLLPSKWVGKNGFLAAR